MAESKAVQFIMLEFPFVDSELYDEWDPRGMKLYWKMRRYVCRSSEHRLAGYWQQGYLAVEGFQGTWAKSLGVSQSVVSKLLGWMEEKRVAICAHKSRTAGDPNVYVLGRVFHVEGSDRPVEVFLLDHHYQSQRLGDGFADDTSHLPPVIALDVDEIDTPLKLRRQTLTPEETHSLENKTYSTENETFFGENKTYSPGKTSNIEDRIVEDRIDTESPPATVEENGPLPSTFQGWKSMLQEPGANQPAVIRLMHETLYPEHPPPDYGYCGKVARRVGGYEVLALRLWELAPRPPVGDVFAYIQGIKKGNGRKESFSEQRKRFLEQAEKGATVDAPAWAVGEVL